MPSAKCSVAQMPKYWYFFDNDVKSLATIIVGLEKSQNGEFVLLVIVGASSIQGDWISIFYLVLIISACKNYNNFLGKF